MTCRAEDHKSIIHNLLELSSEPQCLSGGGIRTGDKTATQQHLGCWVWQTAFLLLPGIP